MRLGSFGSDHHVGTISGSFQGDGLPDATAGPGNEQSATCELSEIQAPKPELTSARKNIRSAKP